MDPLCDQENTRKFLYDWQGYIQHSKHSHKDPHISHYDKLMWSHNPDQWDIHIAYSDHKDFLCDRVNMYILVYDF